MSRIRVLDLAKELGLDTKSTIVKLQEVGIQVKNHFNALSEQEADRLRVYVRSGKSSDKDASQKGPARMVIRRRPAEQGPADEQKEKQAFDQTYGRETHEFERSVPMAEVRSEDRGEAPSAHETEVHVPRAEHASLDEQVRDNIEARVSEQREPSSATTSGVVSTEASGENEINNTTGEQAVVSGDNRQSVPEQMERKSANVGNGNTQKLASGEQVSPQTSGEKGAGAPGAKGSYSAVIVRRAEPTPPPPPQNTSSYGTAYTSGGRGGFRPGDRQGQPSRFAQGRAGQQGQRDEGRQPEQGQGQGRFSGGFQGRDDQRGRPPFNREGRPQYSNEQGQRPGAGPRFGQGQQGGTEGSGPRRFNPTGYTPGQRSEGYSSGSYEGRQEGGRSFGGAPRPPRAPFAPVPETPVTREPARLRSDKEKDKEAAKRRAFEEEEVRRKSSLKVKNRFEDEEYLEDEPVGDVAESEEHVGVRTVYAPVPNRRKASSSFGASKRREAKKAEKPNPTKASKKIIRIDDTITVNDIAGELSVKASAVIKCLMQFGMMAGINQVLDFETASLVVQEFGFEAQNTTVSISDILSKKADDNSAVPLITRPPVVTIMGHVDHGKTSLLDAIRSANVAAREAGGITQHIGAYQVEYEGRKVTFLDTPGHEAFTAMRARGAQVTDVVVLVVAADDGVMPQTIEAISHAKAANVPIVVAINKIDKHGINLDRVHRELAQHGVTPEEWGGEHMFVKVSAKTHEGIGELLEAILLQADVLDLKAKQEGQASGVVLEARLDKARGPVATLLVVEGSLKMSDWVVAGTSYGRVRAMFDDKGNRLTEASPATPVEILGLAEVPGAGESFNCVANDSVAKEAVAYRVNKFREKELAGERKTTLEDLLSRMSAESSQMKELPLIVKADTQGSIEAIRASVKKLDTEKVRTKLIHSAVGGITETDVILAKAANAVVIGFNVRPDKVAAQVAEQEGVDIRFFSIIYELIESVEQAMAGRLAPVKVEKLLGHAEVRNLFSVPKVGMVAGSAVTDGKIVRNAMVRVVRDGTVIYTGRVGSLRRFKEDAKEVLQGFECGIGVENYNDLKVGDVLEVFAIEEVAATLT